MPDNILIMDDSQTIRELIINTLKSFNFVANYHEAENGLEGFRKLLASPMDIIFCDLEMPKIDGFKFLKLLESRPDRQDVPVIILTGMNDRELKIKGLGQGAIDYIVKPFDPEELVARVRVHLKIKHLQDNLKRSNKLLLELSNTDHLTRLYNRRYLMDAMHREIQRTLRKTSSMSIIILDIDNFKQVNDIYGHQQGDVVLQKVAHHLQKGLRSYDIAARYGGEEFIAVLPDTKLNEAIFVAERIRLSIQNIKFDGKMSARPITVSLGVAALPEQGCTTVEGFIKLADDALYLAKSNGRNRVEFGKQYLFA